MPRWLALFLSTYALWFAAAAVVAAIACLVALAFGYI